MSSCDDVNSVNIKKNGENSGLCPANKQQQVESFPKLHSMPNMNSRPQDRLLSLCSEVEPAISLISSVSELNEEFTTTGKVSNIPLHHAINDSNISKDNIEPETTIDRIESIPATTRQSLAHEAIQSHFSSSTISNSEKSIAKRKSNSPPDDTHINTVKNNRPTFVNLDNVDTSDYIVTSKSCNSHLSTKQDHQVDEKLDSIQLEMSKSQNMGNGDTICERKITPSRQALRHAVHNLYRVDDFELVKIGAGFFSEVFKVTHKVNKSEMVLKLNKNRSNRTNMLKEIQLMKNLDHPNILRLEGACVHEGQLHALTEYADGGNLEQVIEEKDNDLPWSLKMSLALDVAKGLAYLHSKGWFHRDLTSKNVLICLSKLESNETRRIFQEVRHCAVIGDFGLATKIPTRSVGKEFRRLQQVGSPYWMSPECLKGEFYDEKADLFSYGIILCELIARMGADPDVLPRTSNFGVDYIAFSAICPDCPPDFIQLTFNCVRIDPSSRPSAQELVSDLGTLLDTQKRKEKRKMLFPNKPSAMCADTKIILKKVGHRRTVSEMSSDSNEKSLQCTLVPLKDLSSKIPHDANEIATCDQDEYSGTNPDVQERNRKEFISPSEKARFHFRNVAPLPPQVCVMSVAKEMSEMDPYYKPRQNVDDKNPFLALPLFQNGNKIFCESDDKTADFKTVEKFLFSSCFELTPNLCQNSNSNFDLSAICSKAKLSQSTGDKCENQNQSISRQASVIEKRHSLPRSSESTSKIMFGCNATINFTPDIAQNNVSSPITKEGTENVSLSNQSRQKPRPSTTNELSNCTDNESSTKSLINEEIEQDELTKRIIASANMNRYFEDQMFQGRVQLLRRLYGGGCWVTQDDSAIELSSFSFASSGSPQVASVFNLPPETVSHLKRRGSCESGFFSSGFDRNYSGFSSRHGKATSSNASGYCGIDDWCSIGMMSSSARSARSSLLTVSDLEEDLRAASIFLSSKRTSSVFTDDSVEDLSSLADFDSWDQRLARSTSTPHGSDTNIMEASVPNSVFPTYGSVNSEVVGSPENRCYEKDIRDIVSYFNSITLNPEANGCNRLAHVTSRTSRQRELDMLFGRKLSNSGTSSKTSSDSVKSFQKREHSQNGGMKSLYSQKNILPRSHKIESLIKRVAEKESKQRYRRTFGAPTPLSASMFQQHQQRLQVCDGIVRSKLQIFDHTKRPQRSRLLDHQKPGHVKAKLAIFDSKFSSNTRKGINVVSNDIDTQTKHNGVRTSNSIASEIMNVKDIIENKLRPLKNNPSDSTETLNA